MTEWLGKVKHRAKLNTEVGHYGTPRKVAPQEREIKEDTYNKMNKLKK